MASVVADKKNPNKFRVWIYDKHGKRISKVITAKNKTEANKEADKLQVKFYETGTIDSKVKTLAEKKNMLVSEFADEFFKHIKDSGEYKDKTVQNYSNHLINIKEYFNRVYLHSIDVKATEDFKIHLKSPNARRNKTKQKPYADSTVKDILTALNCMLNKAVDWGYIDVNPIKRKLIPKVTKESSDWYNGEELKMLIGKVDEYVDNEFKRIELMEKRGTFNEFTLCKERVDAYKYKVIVHIAINTGARRGEILALTRKDIELERLRLSINKSVLYTPNRSIYLEPTTKTGKDRVVGINQNMVEIILKYYKLLDELFEHSDGRIKANDLLFMSLRNTKNAKAGSILFPDPISTWFADFTEGIGMRRLVFHKLRHSALSYMLEAGISVFEVSKIAGHSVNTLLSTYGHSDEDLRVSRASVFNGLYK